MVHLLNSQINSMRVDTMTRQQRYANRIRKQALENLGGKCWYCFSTSNLEIDHICNDGYIERKNGHSRSHVLRASKGNTEGLQLLCVDCHRHKTAMHNSVKANRELKKLEAEYKGKIGDYVF